MNLHTGHWLSMFIMFQVRFIYCIMLEKILSCVLVHFAIKNTTCMNTSSALR